MVGFVNTMSMVGNALSVLRAVACKAANSQEERELALWALKTVGLVLDESMKRIDELESELAKGKARK